MTDNIVDRDELQVAYVDEIIEGMDYKSLEQYARDMLHDYFDKYTTDELIEEVQDHYSHLIA